MPNSLVPAAATGLPNPQLSSCGFIPLKAGPDPAGTDQLPNCELPAQLDIPDFAPSCGAGGVQTESTLMTRRNALAVAAFASLAPRTAHARSGKRAAPPRAQSGQVEADPAIKAIEASNAAEARWLALIKEESAAEQALIAETGDRLPRLRVSGFEIRNAKDLQTYVEEYEPNHRQMNAHNRKILLERVAGVPHPPGSFRFDYELTPEQAAEWERHCAEVRQQFEQIVRAHEEANRRHRTAELEQAGTEALWHYVELETTALETPPTTRAGAIALLAFAAKYVDQDTCPDHLDSAATAIRNAIAVLRGANQS